MCEVNSEIETLCNVNKISGCGSILMMLLYCFFFLFLCFFLCMIYVQIILIEETSTFPGGMCAKSALWEKKVASTHNSF